MILDRGRKHNYQLCLHLCESHHATFRVSVQNFMKEKKHNLTKQTPRITKNYNLNTDGQSYFVSQRSQVALLRSSKLFVISFENLFELIYCTYALNIPIYLLYVCDDGLFCSLAQSERSRKRMKYKNERFIRIRTIVLHMHLTSR